MTISHHPSHRRLHTGLVYGSSLSLTYTDTGIRKDAFVQVLRGEKYRQYPPPEKAFRIPSGYIVCQRQFQRRYTMENKPFFQQCPIDLADEAILEAMKTIPGFSTSRRPITGRFMASPSAGLGAAGPLHSSSPHIMRPGRFTLEGARAT